MDILKKFKKVKKAVVDTINEEPEKAYALIWGGSLTALTILSCVNDIRIMKAMKVIGQGTINAIHRIDDIEDKLVAHNYLIQANLKAIDAKFDLLAAKTGTPLAELDQVSESAFRLSMKQMMDARLTIDNMPMLKHF